MSDENKNLTPVWIAYVDGKRLSTDYEGSLKSIKIMNYLNSPSIAYMLFDISGTNFDEDDTFALMSEVSIHMGYKDDVEEVFKGVVTGFAPRFSEFKQPVMEVIIQSKLFQLNNGNHTRSYINKKPSDIIKDILSKYSLDVDIEDFGPEFKYIEQNDISDLDYIKQLSEIYGKTIYCYDNKVTIKTEITPSNDDVVLEWGKSLIESITSANLENQFSAVTCFGYDQASDTNFNATVKLKDLPLQIGGSHTWEDNSKGYDEHKIHYIFGGIDEEDAKNIASGYLLKRSFQFQTAYAKTEGSYKIKPGNRLNLKYIGSYSSGEYLIKEVTHTFNIIEGYTTECQLVRNFCETSNSSGSTSTIDNERASGQTQKKQNDDNTSSSKESENETQEEQKEEKNPKLINPAWKNSDGQSITKALVGDEVLLCADVQDIDDGKTVKIKIVEKDDDGNDDDVTTLSGKVKDGKIECKWKVKYTADDDDTESQKEMDEKGYTLPEYAFTVEYDGIESDESGLLDIKDEIIINFSDIRNIEGKTLVLKWKDGSEKNIQINDKKIVINDIYIGTASFYIK